MDGETPVGGTRIDNEDDLVGTFLAPLAAGYPGAFGLKDDCAVLAPTPGCELVLKTDPVVGGVHFLLDDEPADIAWKALAVNVSDLAAKGATPRIYLMALSLPEAPERAWMARFADGLGAAQRVFGMHLAGGETDRTPGNLSIAITVIGEVPIGRMVRRTTAKAGDALYVSGTLGDAALGLALRTEAALAGRLGLSADEATHAIGRYLRPQPRVALVEALSAHARAAMDLSDGLMKDLGRMCRASGVGARVMAADAPLSPAMRRALAAEPKRIMDVVAAGDDYEILAAVPLASCADFETAAHRGGVAVTRIGEVISEREVLVLDGEGVPLAPGRPGGDHFQPH